MIIVNLGSTGFSCYFNSKSVKLIMSLHYTIHTVMDGIPDIAGKIQLSSCFGRIFLYKFSFGIRHTVQKGKLVDRTGSGDR